MNTPSSYQQLSRRCKRFSRLLSSLGFIILILCANLGLWLNKASVFYHIIQVFAFIGLTSVLFGIFCLLIHKGLAFSDAMGKNRHVG
jgi:hypothetical protein